MNQLSFFIIIVWSLASCDEYRQFVKEVDYDKTVSKDFGYDLLNPDKKYFMGYSLEEISGLSYVENDLLACVQDESGKIYFYDTKKKAVTRRIKFHKGGDYEGVEVIDRVAYVMESNGDLFVVPMDSGDKIEAKKIKTPFTSENNVEGLGYDMKNHQLIISCKNKGEIKKEKLKGKAVYSFDLKNKKDYNLLFTITKDDIRDYVKEMNRGDEDISFQPSAIALHPIEDRFYVLASSGKALIVLSKDYKIEEYIKLKPAVLHQPEGICFSPRGTLYIASEGDGQDGYILKFKYKK